MLQVVLRDFMWDVFQSTGQIEAYLAYRSCAEENPQPEALINAPLKLDDNDELMM